MWFSKYEKFRSLIVQTIYSTPGSSSPNGEITDDEIVAEWKKMINEKVKIAKSIQDMKDSLKTSETVHTETIEAINNLDTKINGIEVFLFI